MACLSWKIEDLSSTPRTCVNKEREEGGMEGGEEGGGKLNTNVCNPSVGELESGEGTTGAL